MTDFENVRIVSEHPPIKPGLAKQKWQHITLDNNGDIVVGGAKQAGNISIRNVDNKEVISLFGGSNLPGTGGTLRLGGQGSDGRIYGFPSSAIGALNPLPQATIFIHADGRLYLGGNTKNGVLKIYPSSATNQKKATISMNGENGTISTKGEITLQNEDCAEEFDMHVSSSDVEPGTVMVIDDHGMLVQSKKAYDKCVAGVVSGAGKYKPAIILGKKSSATPRIPVALVGKVNCKVDAANSEIQIGDLLTTSETPGYAMKASNHSKAFGAVIGKALRSLKKGRSIIPILVTLQ